MKRLLISVLMVLGSLQLIWAQSFPCDFNIDCSEILPELKVDILIPTNLGTGDQFCAQFQVTNFNYIISMQFDIAYDPSVIEIADCDTDINIGNCLNGLLTSNFSCTNGNIRLVYINPNVEGMCCNDGSNIFEICFTVVGNPLDPIAISIDENAAFTEIGYGLDIFSGICFDTSCNVCTVPTTVSCPNLDIIANFCGASTGMDNGSLTLSACGGVAPYNFSVTELGVGTDYGSGMTSADGEEFTVTGLPCIFYQVVVTDDAGDTDTQIITIPCDAQALSFELDSILPSCFNKETGSVEVIDINGIDGTNLNAYNYSWSNNEFGKPLIDKLGSGVYSVTVSDSNGCTASDEIDLTIDTLKLNYEVIDSASCFGAENGVIKLTAEGGFPFSTGPNTYAFQNDQNPTDCFIINDAVGGENLFLQVWDDPIGLCRDSFTIEVPHQNNMVDIQQLSIDPIECFGGTSDLVEYQITNASLVFATLLDEFGIQVTDPSIVVNVIAGNIIRLENLPGGTYFLDINVQSPPELADCPLNPIDIIIPEPDELILNAVGNNPDCAGNPGSIVYSTSGGTGMYSYLLNNMTIPTSQILDLGNDEFEIINLNGGMYEFVVQDENNCGDTVSFDFPMAGSLTIDIDTIQGIECGSGDIGVLIVDVTPACPSCIYEWVDIDNNVIANGSFIQNLGPGCYTASVTDPNQNCSATATACLQATDNIVFDVNLTEPFCFEGTNGQIGIDISQGQTPFTYNWEDFPQVTGSILAPIPAGTYCVTIGDASNCEVDTCIELSNPLPLELVLIGTQPAECFGESSGIVTVNGQNGFMGTNNFSYLVYDDNGVEVADATGIGDVDVPNLAPGDYTIIVIDGQCFSAEVPFTIDQPDLIMVDLDNSTLLPPSCYEFCDGSITATASGGTGPYTFSWVSNGLVSPNINDLCGDTWHYVDIEDMAGCIVRDSIFLSEPDSLQALLDPDASNGLTCANLETGVITINTIGGTAPYSYNWENNISNTNTANNLSLGIYNVTVSDDSGCTAIFSEELTSPDPIVFSMESPMTPDCFGELTCITVNSASGGSGSNYTFSINQGPNIPLDSCVYVIADEYLIKVFDGTSADCFVDTTIVIDQPNPLTVDLGADILEVPLGDSSVLLQANISAINDVTIEWTSDEPFECQDPLCQIIAIYPSQAAEYSVSVIDENGCSAEDEIQIIIGQERPVYIPNAFSPNGDGYNENFGIYLGNGIESVEYFGIFDRWGNLMFEAEDFDRTTTSQNRWDGKFKDEPVLPGVYAYVARIKFLDDFTQTFRGTLTVVK